MYLFEDPTDGLLVVEGATGQDQDQPVVGVQLPPHPLLLTEVRVELQPVAPANICKQEHNNHNNLVATVL